MKKNCLENTMCVLTVILVLLITGCTQPLSSGITIQGGDSLPLLKGDYPHWVPGTIDPNQGDRFEYSNHLFEAIQDPGMWETPPIGGNWFWNDLGELQPEEPTSTNTTGNSTINSGPSTTTTNTTTTNTTTTNTTTTNTTTTNTTTTNTTTTDTATTNTTTTNTFTPVAPLEPNAFPDNIFMPYIDISKHGLKTISQIYAETGQKYFVLSFIISDTRGNPTWLYYDTNNSYAQPEGAGLDSRFANVTVMNEINAIRRAGGEVAVSFGGAAGLEISSHPNITTTAQIQAAYQAVIDKYKITWIDLNLENAAALLGGVNTAIMERRMEAVKNLQDANPGLKVSLQLLSNPELGLTVPRIVEIAAAKGVNIHSVGIMTMHFGSYYSRKSMGEYAIDTANNTRRQLVNRGLNSTKIGICVMNGTNQKDNIFTLQCAERVKNFVNRTWWVNWLSMWSVSRDNGTGSDLITARFDSSGITQEEWQFTNIFKPYTGSPVLPPPDPSSINGGPSQNQTTDTNAWRCGAQYNAGDIVSYTGSSYKCLFPHQSNAAWTPVAALTLWQQQ